MSSAPAAVRPVTRRPRAAPNRVVAHVTAHPALWVLFVLAAVWIAWFAVRIHVYFLMPDELRYVKQAVSWSRGHPVVPGSEAWTMWSQVQPILMAPLWGLFSSPHAYFLTHVLNAVLFASAVFPGYVLARAVLGSHRWALAAAVLTVVIPWSALTGVVMLENAAYPLALWAMVAVHRAGMRPGLRSDLIAVGALLLAFFGRTELLVLWATLPAVLLAQGLRYPADPDAAIGRRLLAVVSRHRLVVALGAVAVLIALVDKKLLLGDAPPGKVLGPGSLGFGLDMLAYVAGGIAMLPLALSLAWVAATIVRPLSPERHAFAVILTTATVLLTVIIGGGTRALAVVASLGVVDRYLFYVAPLLVIGMIAFLLERRPLSLLTLGGGLVAAVVFWTAELRLAGPTFNTPSATWHPILNDAAERVGRALDVQTLTSGKLLAGVTVLASAAVALARRRVRPELVTAVVVGVVGVYVAVETTYTRHQLEKIQPGKHYARGRDWVDATLPRGARSALLLSSLGVDAATAQATWWDVSFWNRAVTAVRYAPGAEIGHDGQAVSKGVTVVPADGRVDGLSGLHYLVRAVVDRRFGFRGESTLGAPHNNLQLWQLPSPDRLAWWYRGPDETGYVPAGRRAVVRVFADGKAGRRRVTMPIGTPFGARRPSRFAISSAGRRVAAGRVGTGATRSVSVDVTLAAAGHADLVLEASPGGGASGLQFFGAEVRPSRRPAGSP